MADRMGQQFGNYRLIHLLGHGGFAEVYLGEHIYLGTQAAIKILHTQLAREDMESFRREASTVAQLVHPHIVRVFDFGIERATPFLVMDYAPSGSARMRHPKGVPIALPTVVGYVKQIGDALQYAHDQHLIHRDIKPENLLLGRNQEILLSDFGVALIEQTTHSQSTQNIAGTASYIAPEQFQGRPRAASDQYALAVLAYEWLCGDCPFHGSFLEVASQHLMIPPPTFQEKGASIPPAVEAVVMRALAKKPHERFPTILDFATALEQASQDVDHHSVRLLGNTPSASSMQKDALPHAEPSPRLVAAPITPVHESVAAEQELDLTKLATSPRMPMTHSPSELSDVHATQGEVVSTPTVSVIRSTQSSIQPLPTRYTQGKLLLIGLILLLIGGSALLYRAMVTHFVNPLATTHLNAIATATAQGYAAANTIMFGSNAAHTRSNSSEHVLGLTNIAHLALDWAYAAAAAVRSSPTVFNGIVYVGSEDHKLYAFDTTCRKVCSPLWSYATGGAVDSSPAVADGILYVGSDDHKLYAFDATCRRDCTPLWSYATAAAIDSSPTVANGMVYIGSADHKLYAFDATCRSACTPLWSYATAATIESSPAVDNGIVYVGSDDDKLYAFDATCRSACTPLWSYATGDVILSSPVVANGMVYIGSADHKLYAFDATCRSACTPLWSYFADDVLRSSPAVANGLLYVGSRGGTLYAFAATCRSACTPLWSYHLTDAIDSSPTVANGIVYFGSDDRKVYAFAATCRSACTPVWSYFVGGTIDSSPTVTSGVVYIGSENNKLYAFRVAARP
ncbi:MAG: PQQ-binding-like beta-propeller repeat protein [Ktedonobacteraceae bacterium]|nr:PQQ-binding-like beta-propeller repeat protein [Ktedonobacteraceae bacterium]